MGPDVVVRVHAHADLGRLVETVRKLQPDGREGAGIVLLPDDSDALLLAALTADPALVSLWQWEQGSRLACPCASTAWHRAATRRS